MTLFNALDRPMAILDIRIAGTSVLADVRAAMLVAGRLEDKDDIVTVLPGEGFDVAGGDSIMWFEPYSWQDV